MCIHVYACYAHMPTLIIRYFAYYVGGFATGLVHPLPWGGGGDPDVHPSLLPGGFPYEMIYRGGEVIISDTLGLTSVITLELIYFAS